MYRRIEDSMQKEADSSCVLAETEIALDSSSTAPENIVVEVFESFEDSEHMRPEWDVFMESLGAEIFLSYDWCRTWWKYYGNNRRLRVFFFRKAGQLCGVLPVFWESVGVTPVAVTVVKMVGSDFIPITFSMPVADESLEKIIDLFTRRLHEECRWDILYLGAICGKYPSVERLVGALKTLSDGAYRVDVRANEVQTYFQLADSWEEQLAGLSQRQRTKTRRVYKEIKSKGMVLTSAFANEKNLGEWFVNFVQMHQAQWLQAGMPGHFADWPSAHEFHKEMASVQLARNRLRLLQIKLDDKVIGYDYIYKFGQTYMWFLSARTALERDSRIDFHRISFGEKVENALRDGVKFIDAGRGVYEYKLVMGGRPSPVRSISVYPHGPLSLTKVWLFRSLVWLVNTCYSKIWRRRIAPRLGLKLGPFWGWWTRTHMLIR
jgi:CelD/BcsL family acetyltransferase involved in cellulose biosynthesis